MPRPTRLRRDHEKSKTRFSRTSLDCGCTIQTKLQFFVTVVLSLYGCDVRQAESFCIGRIGEICLPIYFISALLGHRIFFQIVVLWWSKTFWTQFLQKEAASTTPLQLTPLSTPVGMSLFPLRVAACSRCEGFILSIRRYNSPINCSAKPSAFGRSNSWERKSGQSATS